MDPDFARSVKEWTTRPEFSSPLVDHLPKAAGVPSPKDVLGYYIGQPQKLTRTADIYRYYRALERATPRVKVMTIGRTDEGRECVVVAISDEAAIRELDRYRGYLGQLADPRKLSEAVAAEIIGNAKPIYHLMAGLHSGETGPPEMLMELAYRLAVEDSPLIRAIRSNVIVTMTAVAEPDGRDRYVDWYYRHKLDEKSEQDSVAGPPYWGKYIYHDNNRDINYSQVTMRNLLEWYLAWHPPVMHDLHESVPFLYTFSGQAPQQSGLDPILYGEQPWFANHEMAQMLRYGMPGVWTHAFVDMWSPGYLAFMSSNHNGLVRMYETFGNGGANTMPRKVDPDAPGGGRTKREWYRPLPPYKDVTWSLRNNTNYMETAVLSALELTSQFPRLIVENFYRKSRNSVEAGRSAPPYGYVIPLEEASAARARMMAKLLRVQGIEVGLAAKEVKLKEGTFPAGSYLIKRDQPYGRLAKILLEKQDFPDASLRTYDDTGWTMGLMFRVKVMESSDKSILDVETRDTEPPPPPLSDGPVYRIEGANEAISLVHRLKGVKITAMDQTGALLVQARDRDRLVAANQGLGLRLTALPEVPPGATHEVDLPRLAMFSTWGSTQEAGWVRHAFDHFEVAYDLIYKERVRQGNLRTQYDVILIPSQAGSGKRLVFDIEPRGKPLAYTKTAEYVSHGMYGSSEDISGGMGLEGAAELRNFVEQGGTLITLGAASFFPPEFGLTRSVDAGRPSPQFYAPGPIVEAEMLRPTHPVFYGYADTKTPVRYANGPLLTVPERDKGQILAQFTGGERGVLSGLMRSPGEISKKPAIVDVPVGKGRVLIFATNPCYRWQNHGEFAMLFNAILHYNDIK
jgi:hypothetical protein